MSLITPILFNISSFDKAYSQIFRFSSTGGDQVVANRLTITYTDTGTIVYNQKVSTFQLAHTLPANTLTNGITYNATVTTYNSSDQESTPSNVIQFTCYTTPQFVIDNIPSGGILSSSNFNFELLYEQIEGEKLSSYRLDLYDTQGGLISTSGEATPSASAIYPFIAEYEFSGFSNNTVYYIQGFGQTDGGTQIQTPRYQLNVAYIQPSLTSLIQLSCNCEGGYVSITSVFKDVVGTSQPSPPIYIDNSAVDLRQSGSYVYFGNGDFSIVDNFTASLWGNNFNENSVLLNMINDVGGSITVRYLDDFDAAGKVYVDCAIESGGTSYYVYSPSIDKPADSDKLQVWLREVNGLMDIRLVNISSASEVT